MLVNYKLHIPNRWGWMKKFLYCESWLPILVNENLSAKAVLEEAEGEEIHQVNDTLARLYFLLLQPCGRMFGPSKARLLGWGADETTEPLIYSPSLSILPPHNISSTAPTQHNQHNLARYGFAVAALLLLNLEKMYVIYMNCIIWSLIMQLLKQWQRSHFRLGST